MVAGVEKPLIYFLLLLGTCKFFLPLLLCSSFHLYPTEKNKKNFFTSRILKFLVRDVFSPCLFYKLVILASSQQTKDGFNWFTWNRIGYLGIFLHGKQEVGGLNCWIFWKSEKLGQSTSEIDSLEFFLQLNTLTMKILEKLQTFNNV